MRDFLQSPFWFLRKRNFWKYLANSGFNGRSFEKQWNVSWVARRDSVYRVLNRLERSTMEPRNANHPRFPLMNYLLTLSVFTVRYQRNRSPILFSSSLNRASPIKLKTLLFFLFFFFFFCWSISLARKYWNIEEDVFSFSELYTWSWTVFLNISMYNRVIDSAI